MSLYVDLPPGMIAQSLAQKAVILTNTARKGKAGTFISFLDKLFCSPACRLVWEVPTYQVIFWVEMTKGHLS